MKQALTTAANVFNLNVSMFNFTEKYLGPCKTFAREFLVQTENGF